MDHRQAVPLLATYALGATPDDERPDIEAHLAACPTCCSHLTELQAAAAQLVDGASPAGDVDQDRALERSWHEVRRQLHADNR